jgi:glycosyltransferase involved in cell wall biosynthesis
METEYGTVHRLPVMAGLDPMPGFRHRRHQAVWRLPRLARAVTAFARRHDGPRLFHSFGVYGWVGVTVAGRLARDGLAAAAIVSAYDTLVHESEARLGGIGPHHGRRQRLAFAVELLWARVVADRFERRGYHEARLILVNYDSVRRMLAERYGVGAKVRKVTYAPESAFLDEGGTGRALAPPREGDAAGPPMIVCVSRHDPRKGVDVLLEALGRLLEWRVDFRAVLIGGGPLLEAHRRLGGRPGMAARVTITGFVPDPRPYLEAADIFVLPSLEEGSGSVALLEALHVGTAVVASRVDGIPEDVVHEESALLVPSRDPEALAAALRRLLADPTLRHRLATQGHALFERTFSAAAFTRALGETYAGLVDSHAADV